MLIYLSRGLSLNDVVIITIIMVFAFIFHNVVIAWMASRYGDESPRYAGFLSFEPQRHLTPLGIGFFLILGFGWPTDVNVNSRNYRRRGKDEAIVWYSGPASYFAIALLCIILGSFFNALGGSAGRMVYISLRLAATIATLHGVINLFPIYPLDGAKAALALGNPQLRRFIQQMASYGNIGFFLFFILMSYTGVTGALMSIFLNFFEAIGNLLTSLL